MRCEKIIWRTHKWGSPQQHQKNTPRVPDIAIEQYSKAYFITYSSKHPVKCYWDWIRRMTWKRKHCWSSKRTQSKYTDLRWAKWENKRPFSLATARDVSGGMRSFYIENTLEADGPWLASEVELKNHQAENNNTTRTHTQKPHGSVKWIERYKNSQHNRVSRYKKYTHMVNWTKYIEKVVGNAQGTVGVSQLQSHTKGYTQRPIDSTVINPIQEARDQQESISLSLGDMLSTKRNTNAQYGTYSTTRTTKVKNSSLHSHKLVRIQYKKLCDGWQCEKFQFQRWRDKCEE